MVEKYCVRKNRDNKKTIALVPVSSRSERVPEKNFRPFAGLPLFLHTLIHAMQSGIFESIYVTSDTIDRVRDEVKKLLGYEEGKKKIIYHGRPAEFAKSDDIGWISDLFLNRIDSDIHSHYMILRPTSPFRSFGTIRRVWDYYNSGCCEHALKTITPVAQRPEKMWTIPKEINGNGNKCFMRSIVDEDLTWERQSISFCPLYIQNGCIDICPTRILRESKFTRYTSAYTGDMLRFFVIDELEGFDLNTKHDWIIGEMIYKCIFSKQFRVEPLTTELFFSTGSRNDCKNYHIN